MTVHLNPKGILKTLFIIVFILLLCHVGVNIIKFTYVLDNGIWFENSYVWRLITLFDFDTEHNVPTFYSSLALLFSAILLFLIAFKNKKSNQVYFPWLILGLVFLFLSFDEILELHEHFVRLTQRLFELSGFGTAYWTIPYLIGLFLLFIVLFKFLKLLPKKTLYLFLISGGIFLSGAVGMEVIGGRYLEFNGINTPVYCFLYTIEELLEMAGIILFIYSLTSFKSFSITVK